MISTMRGLLRRSLIYLVIVSFVLLWFIPVLWSISTSLKPESILFRQPLEWIPRPFTFDNYLRILQSRHFPLIRWYFNSFFVASMTTLIVFFSNTLAGYAFARIDFAGKRLLFGGVLATMMIPGQVLLVPLYLLMDRLDLIDSYIALMIPVATGAFGVFLLRQFFLGFPTDLEDAARIDGVSTLGIIARIIIPNSVAAIAALSILTFLSNWNSFVWPLIVTISRSMYTIPIGLAQFQNEHQVQYHLVMAATVMSSTPLLVVFLFFQKHIIQGITMSGLKG